MGKTPLPCVLLVALVWGSVARGQGSPAEAAFLEAQAHYHAGRYGEAAARYQQAYDLSREPDLLFNVGQAQRLAGRCREAVAAYQGYLDARPQGESRGDAEARIAELGPRCPAPVAAPPLVPPPRPGLGPLRITGIALAGTGLVAAGVGVFFGMRASAHADELTDRFAGGGTWDEPARELERKGERATLISTSLLVTGGVLVIGGGVLWFVGRPAERTPAVSIAPLRGGAALVVTGKLP